MSRYFTLTLVLFLVSGEVLFAESPCPDFDATKALSQYLAEYSACKEPDRQEFDAAASKTKVDAGAKVTRDMQAASPASATPGFGSQLRDSIEDYLPFFNVAFDGVSTSDDDKSLTIRFNPIRAATIGSLGLSVTATEPEAGDLLLNEIPEAARSSAREVLESGLDQTDNLTFKGSFSFERKAKKHDRWLMGRSHKNYSDLVEKHYLPAFGESAFSGEAVSRAIDKCEQQVVDRLELAESAQPRAQLMGDIRGALGDGWGACLKLWEDERARIVEADKKLDALAWIPFLIDNQPQLFLTAEVQDRAEEVGRSGWNVKLSYEKGFNNLNTFLRRVAGKPKTEWSEAFYDMADSLGTKEIEAGNKMTFSLTYAERDPYSFSRMIGEGDDAVSLDLNLPRATEVCGKVAYHRNATWHPMEIKDQKVFPKFHASLEYIDVSDDPKRRDRMVGVLTYEIPMPSGVALPISLTYANHSQFLGEVDKELSAHFGLSYKLPGK